MSVTTTTPKKIYAIDKTNKEVGITIECRQVGKEFMNSENIGLFLRHEF